MVHTGCAACGVPSLPHLFTVKPHSSVERPSPCGSPSISTPHLSTKSLHSFPPHAPLPVRRPTLHSPSLRTFLYEAAQLIERLLLLGDWLFLALLALQLDGVLPSEVLVNEPDASARRRRAGLQTNRNRKLKHAARKSQSLAGNSTAGRTQQ